MKTILLLDDDPRHLENLSSFLEENGFDVCSCQNVGQATRAVGEIELDFAIVDLFLEGNDGEHLSNDFVANVLIPAAIPYGRMSSAPGLVPKEFAGKWIFDKRRFRREPQEFLKVLLGSL